MPIISLHLMNSCSVPHHPTLTFMSLGAYATPIPPPHPLTNYPPRSTKCVFLGYPSRHKGYRCLDLSTRHIIISRHVVFDEQTFPYAPTTPPLAPTPPEPFDPVPPIPPSAARQQNPPFSAVAARQQNHDSSATTDNAAGSPPPTPPPSPSPPPSPLKGSSRLTRGG